MMFRIENFTKNSSCCISNHFRFIYKNGKMIQVPKPAAYRPIWHKNYYVFLGKQSSRIKSRKLFATTRFSKGDRKAISSKKNSSTVAILISQQYLIWVRCIDKWVKYMYSYYFPIDWKSPKVYATYFYSSYRSIYIVCQQFMTERYFLASLIVL